MSTDVSLKETYPSWQVYDTTSLVTNKMEGYSSGIKHILSLDSTQNYEEGK